MEENETETTEETAVKGRPRPEATVALDAKVLEAITAGGDEGVTKDALAEQTGEAANKVYLALYRLRTTDQIHKVRAGRTSVWKAGVKPAEEPTEAPVEG